MKIDLSNFKKPVPRSKLTTWEVERLNQLMREGIVSRGTSTDKSRELVYSLTARGLELVKSQEAVSCE